MKLNDFKRCLDDLKAQNDNVYKEYGFSNLLTSLDKQPKDRIHSYKIESLSNKYKTVFEKHGQGTFESLRKIVLLESVITSWENIFSDKYPQSIQEQYKITLNRFFQFSSTEEGWGKYNEDVYWKDLSIARQQMFPAGAQIVEAYSGFGLKQGLSLNMLQSVRFLTLIAKSGGREGYYQIHTHMPELSEFNEAGWNSCYVRLAEMLEKNARIKGMVGGSWFYDPQLEHVSPRLMYLQKVPINGGAKLFHIGKDTTGNPFAKSKTRRKLYDEGKYIPQSYLLVWPRKELMDWADRFKRKQNDYKKGSCCISG